MNRSRLIEKTSAVLRLIVGSFAIFGAVTAAQACNGAAPRGQGIVPEAAADESGSRLLVNFLTTSDGAKHYLGTFHDVKLKQDCDFGPEPRADGKWHCVVLHDTNPNRSIDEYAVGTEDHE